MTADGRSFDGSDAESIPLEEPYTGAMGKTRMEAVHWSLPDGSLVSVRVHTVVNAATDPALAERLASGDLNWAQPGGSDELQPVPVPVVFHDPDARLFVLVLPEPFRTRELAERAALLSRLAQDPEHAVPDYVLHFAVIYGEGLSACLRESRVVTGAAKLDDQELADREEAIVSREAKLAEWEERLGAQQAELEVDLKQREILDHGVDEHQESERRQREQELSRRESELREVEQHVIERQLEVERHEKLLQHRAKELDRRESRAGDHETVPTEPDSPTRVADRESMELKARESAGLAGTDTSGLILDGPLDVGDEGPELEADEEVLPKRRDAEELVAADALEDGAELEEIAPDDDVDADDADGGEAADSAPAQKTRDTVTTPLAQAVLDATEDATAEPEEEPEPIEAEPEEEQVSELPEELAHWHGDEVPAAAIFERDGRLHLANTLPAEEAELFVGLEPTALLQLHELPTHPVVALVLVAEIGEEIEGLDSPAAFWIFDITDDADQALLDRLADDFRFVMEIYDEDLVRVTSGEAHFSLEENVRVVRERARSALEQLAGSPDFSAAREAFSDPERELVPQGELPFGPNEFQNLESAAAVAEAWPLIGEWSQTEREDELILRRSFPVSHWRRMRLRVLRQAIDFGLWMDADLRRLALDSGYATSRKDLLRGCLAGFERVCTGELTSELTPIAEHENWTALLEEAERIGVMVDTTWEQLAEAASKRRDFAESDEADDGPLAEGSREGTVQVALEETEYREEEEVAELDDEDVQEVDADDSILEDEDVPAEEEPEADDEEPMRGEPVVEVGDGGAMDDEVAALAPAELVASLVDEESRLSAALELCRRQELKALPEIFGVLDRMRKSEVTRLFPILVGLGSEVEYYLGESLRSGSTLVRQASALALGALESDQATEALVDLLLDEPTEIWAEVALALGDIGGGALMSLATRIRHSTAEQWERLAHAMAAICIAGGQRELVVELAGSRDENAATVARRALDLVGERCLVEDDEDDDLPPRSDSVRFFSRRFFDARAYGEAELGEEDILDEADIVDNADVMEEAPLDHDPSSS